MIKIYKIEEIGNLGVIYKLTSPSGKYYIGQTWSIKLRWKYYENKDCKCQKKLYHALCKYGFDNFKKEIIDLAETQMELDNKEIWYIDNYDAINNGYNLALGGANGKHSEETKEKIRQYHIGTKLSEETKEKIRKAHLGKKLSKKNRILAIKNLSNKGCPKKYDYIVTPPNGKSLIVKDFKLFCKENNLKFYSLFPNIRGEHREYNGWIAVRKPIKN